MLPLLMEAMLCFADHQ